MLWPLLMIAVIMLAIRSELNNMRCGHVKDNSTCFHDIFSVVLGSAICWRRNIWYPFYDGGLKGEKVSDFRFDGEKPISGTYDLDIYLNNQWRGKYELNVKDEPDDTCLTWDLIHRLGIKSEGIKVDKEAQCVPLKTALKGELRLLMWADFALISMSRRLLSMNLNTVTSSLKTGTGGLMRCILPIMWANTIAIIKTPVTVKILLLVLIAGWIYLVGNYILMPVTIRLMIVMVSGRVIRFIWSAASRKYWAHCARVICTHHQIFLIPFGLRGALVSRYADAAELKTEFYAVSSRDCTK